MDNKTEPSIDRKFLHDIATPISIVRLHAKRLLKMSSQRDASEIEKQLLEQILEAVKSMETLHANHRSYISEQKAA